MNSTKTSASDELDSKWRSTARTLFGGEIGPLEEYSKWLSDSKGDRVIRDSSLSGRKVVFSLPYHSGSCWMDFEEVDFSKKYGPLDINDLKDIESIIEALGERICYTGGMVLGQSKFIEKSANIIDSYYVFESERIAGSKYIGHCTIGTNSESVFGSNSFGSVNHSIKVFGFWNSTRCFETSKTDFSSDCYYSHGLSKSAHCMFCFNVKNKHYAIGNLELSADKYNSIKNSLLEQMREKLNKEKSLPSLVSFFLSEKPDYSLIKKAFKPEKKLNAGKGGIEEKFSNTAKVVLGLALENINDYGPWLLRHVPPSRGAFSCASSLPVLLPGYSNFQSFPKDRLLTLQEAEEIGPKLSITLEDAESISFDSVPKILSKIAFFSPEWSIGNVRDNCESPINIDSTDCYRSTLNISSKHCAYSYYPRDSECLFGVNETRSSQFCINCYESAKLIRCFEMDSCKSCSDSMFCHNCENLRDCMFCFNVKNLQYAVGNVELTFDEYKQIKEAVLKKIANELQEKKSIELSIFNLGQK